MKNYQHYINGEWVDPIDGQWFDTQNPYTDDVWAKIAKGNESDVNLAVEAATNAFYGEWNDISPTGRGKLLNKLAELILSGMRRDSVKLKCAITVN